MKKQIIVIYPFCPLRFFVVCSFCPLLGISGTNSGFVSGCFVFLIIVPHEDMALFSYSNSRISVNPFGLLFHIIFTIMCTTQKKTHVDSQLYIQWNGHQSPGIYSVKMDFLLWLTNNSPHFCALHIHFTSLFFLCRLPFLMLIFCHCNVASLLLFSPERSDKMLLDIYPLSPWRLYCLRGHPCSPV